MYLLRFLKYADKLALLIHTRFLQAKLDCGELPRIVGSANEPSGDVRLRADAWAGGAGRKGYMIACILISPVGALADKYRVYRH